MGDPSFIAQPRQYTRGMKVFRVHPTDVARLEVTLPPLDAQKAIVSALDSIYEK